MIRGNIVGFTGNESDTRYGDSTIIGDLVIDGYFSVGAKNLVKRLKKIGLKKPYLAASHAHGDHIAGLKLIINDSWFEPQALYCYDPETLSDGLSNSEIRGDYNSMKAMIADARRRGIPVYFVGNGDKFSVGDINVEVYHEQPKYKGNTADPHGWEFVNDGSLCFWFPDLKYLTTGDAGLWCAQRYNLDPVFIKIGHHENTVEGDTLKPAQMAVWLYNHGCKYCWGNDITKGFTSFNRTGRQRCVEAGMKHFDIFGDINFLACEGTMTIYKGSEHVSYKIPYKGKKTLKYATLTIVEDVLAGSYGNNNDRITNLLDKGFSPVSVQTHVNRIAKAFGKG